MCYVSFLTIKLSKLGTYSSSLLFLSSLTYLLLLLSVHSQSQPFLFQQDYFLVLTFLYRPQIKTIHYSSLIVQISHLMLPLLHFLKYQWTWQFYAQMEHIYLHPFKQLIFWSNFGRMMRILLLSLFWTQPM
jgi:hypothetical protein